MAGRTEFPERAFEFAFNSEIVRCHRRVLQLGTPLIPSQNAEWYLGFDASFALKGGRFLFLQYKVGYHAEHPSGTGAEVYDLYGGPYVRVRLPPKDDYHQHNTLVALQRLLRGHGVFYVVPLFGALRALQEHVANDTLVVHCGFVSLLGMPVIPLGDREPHSISHATDKIEAHLHSEAMALHSLPWDAVRSEQYGMIWDHEPEPLREVRRAIDGAIAEAGRQPITIPDSVRGAAAQATAEPQEQEQRQLAAEIAYLCAQQLDVSWFAPAG